MARRVDPESSRPGPWSRDEFLWRVTTFDLFGYPIPVLPLIFIVMAVLILGPPFVYFFQLRDISEDRVIVMMGMGLTASLFFIAIMDTLWIIRVDTMVRKALWTGAIISILGTSAAVYANRFQTTNKKSSSISVPSP
jgi:hypothetical protein